MRSYPQKKSKNKKRNARTNTEINIYNNEYIACDVVEYHEPKREIKPFTPMTVAQAEYEKSIRNYKVTLGIGPPGTGKSHVALAIAAELLRDNKIHTLYITRPVEEVGKSLGAVPGDIEEKYALYMEPVNKILNKILGASYVKLLKKSKRICFQPLAFLRGATFEDCFVILDEAQNTTIEQMKMFLARKGHNCTYVIDGDIEQTDIRGTNGLADMIPRLAHISELNIVRFGIDDIVRDPLIKQFILAYR